MTVESIQGEEVESAYNHEVYEDKFSEWNGRSVQLSPSYTATLLALQMTKLVQIQHKGDPDIRCFSGSASLTASKSLDGEKEVEASIEVTNTKGNVSAEVSGSVSKDTSGSTSAEAKVEVKVSW